MNNSITIAVLQVSSPSFKNNDFIPSKYSCDGEGINPAIAISKIPAQTKSLAIIVDDPDAPNGTFDHWVMWNIDPSVTMIKENSAPGTEGKNGKNTNEYTGPCPPNGTHHYHFKVYALDSRLELTKDAHKTTLEAAMKDHILAEGEMIGLYRKTAAK